MPIINKLIEIETEPKINIHNITPQIQYFLTSTSIKNGQVLVFSRHTTTALSINENEVRLLEDIKVFLQKLAPESDSYLHNDLHLRDIPEDEPINAHSHLTNFGGLSPQQDRQPVLGRGLNPRHKT
jgi:secondary thiamine-phosphate synthase enzyme